MKKPILILCLFTLASALAQAGVPETKGKLRPLSPDRPHQTESSYTTDAGHIQIEGDFLSYFINHPKEGPVEKTLCFFSFNAKVGLTKNSDFEVLSGVFSSSRFDGPAGSGSTASQVFFPDLLLRYKLNILGNDSGQTSIALMPVLRTSNFFREKFEGRASGILVNIDHEIDENKGMGFTGGISSFSLDPFFREYELFSTFSFDYRVVSVVRHFVEVSYRYNKLADYLHGYSVDSGITITPSDNFQLDTGFYYFLPQKSPFFFAGATIRI